MASKNMLIRKGLTVTTKKTKAQSGLSIKRTGYNSYTFEWKCGQEYDSQSMGYATHGASKWRSYTYPDITKGQTKKAITIDRSQFYPQESAYCDGIKLALKAKGKVTIDSKKKKAVFYDPCDWVYKDITIYQPRTPSLTATLDETLTNKTKFEWSVADAGSDSLYVFHDVEWQTVLVKDSPEKLTESQWTSSTKGTGSASGEKTYIEDTVTLAGGSYTRWFRCRSRGIAGTRGWTYASHVYARPKQAKIDLSSLRASTTEAGGFQCYCKWEADSSFAYPIDSTTVQYCITVPDVGLSCPTGASWTDANVSADTEGYDAVTFSIDDQLSEDQCLFVRVNTIHDSNVTYGAPALASVGKLKKPSAPEVDISTATHNATIECTNNADEVPDSFIVVEFQMGNDPSNVFDIGIIPHGEDSVTVQCPDWGTNSIAFIARAVVGTYVPVERPDGADCYVVTKKHKDAESDRTSYEEGSIPTAPTGVTATATETTGTVRIEWEWSWSGARAAELSWADHSDAWESTDEPDTYVVSNLNASRWNVAGLAVGKRWYFKVRLMSSEDDANYSPYSDIRWVDLFSTPPVPSLDLSKSVITEEEPVTASWTFATADGSTQTYAEICDIADTSQLDKEYVLTTDTTVNEAKTYYSRGGSGTSESPYTYNVVDLAEYQLTEDEEVIDGKKYYERSGAGTGASPYVYTVVINPDSITGLYERVENPQTQPDPSYLGLYEQNRRIIAHTQTEQQVTIYPNAENINWKAGETHFLAVKVKGENGQILEEWSDFKSVTVAYPITCDITDTSLVEQDGEVQLQELPLTVEVTGAGSEHTTIVTIERAESYILDRPDESRFTGFEGEMIFSKTQTGDEEVEISREDIEPQHFDDGARYRITATVKDSIGQVANAEPVEFIVRWTDQAVMPEAWAVVDTRYNAVVIGIETPTGASQDATCDIYRLSSDKPELIYEGAPLGSKIVDPYPAIGESGGHRIVYKTANGDYITEQNMMAWIDLHEDEDDILDVDYAIIDFEGGQIRLHHNLDLSQSWDKDFKETAYLGGSVQGDWNPAVSRTSSLSSTVIRLTEMDSILQMRRLAVSPSECHIRTPDGSSYAADIQVSESSGTETRNLIYDYSLKITRIDTERLDGLTLEEWQAQHEEE